MPQTGQLSILVIGAGAIGTYIGGSLKLCGHHVVFLEQPGVAEALRKTGMTLELPSGKHVIEKPDIVTKVADTIQNTKFDAALFAVKSYHTDSAISPLAEHKQHIPPIFCIQNGVDNEITIGRIFGEKNVIPGTLTSAIGKPGMGHIVVERLRGMGVAGAHPIARRLTNHLSDAGLNAHFFPNPLEMKWSKLITNLIANPTSAILNMSATAIFENPGLFKLEIYQIREALKVMKAMKIRVVDLPGTPIRLLAFATRYLPLSISRPFMIQAIGKGRGQKMPSFHIDLYGGAKKSEVRYLHGAVVGYGEKYGVATPVNRFLTKIMISLTNEEISKEHFANKPDKFLRAFNSEYS